MVVLDLFMGSWRKRHTAAGRARSESATTTSLLQSSGGGGTGETILTNGNNNNSNHHHHHSSRPHTSRPTTTATGTFCTKPNSTTSTTSVPTTTMMKRIRRFGLILIFAVGFYRVVLISWKIIPYEYSRVLASTMMLAQQNREDHSNPGTITTTTVTTSSSKNQFVPQLPGPTPAKWGLTRPDTLTVTRGVSYTTEPNHSVVILLTDSRAGGDALLKLTEEPCPEMPPAALVPTEMPWLEPATQKCTYANWVKLLERHREMKVCHNDAASTAAPEQDDPRCAVIRSIVDQTDNVTDQKEKLLQQYLHAFQTNDTNLIGCLTTCRPNAVKVLKVVSDWGLPMQIFPQGPCIRLTRRNYFERYMAFVIATKTNIWSINSAEDKRKQVDAFQHFTLNLAEMLSFFDKFLREDATADQTVQEHFQTTLWVDHQDVRDRPEIVTQVIRRYLTNHDEMDDVVTTAGRNIDTTTTTTSWPRGKEFQQKLTNREIVGEMLGTAGRANWIDQPNPQTIHLILLDEYNKRPYDLPPGIQATRVQTLETLKLFVAMLKPNDWIVVSDWQTTVNPHIRTTSHWYSALSNFRSKLEQLHGKVIVASANISKDNQNDIIAASRKLSSAVHREGLILAGTAEAVLKIIINGDDADENMVETIVDDGSMFGTGLRFEGVMEKIGCSGLVASRTVSTVADQQLFVNSVQKHCFQQPIQFPVWGDHNNEKIHTEPILEHIDRLLLQKESLAHIDLHFGNEILYHVNSTGIYGSPVVRDQYRVLPTEQLLVRAHAVLMDEHKTGRMHWPALQNVLTEGNHHGFTYFGWYGDWKGCNQYNAPHQQTVPILTTCATVACNYSFPSPAYMTIVNAQPDMTHWLSVFDEFEASFPWDKKISQVYWRGGLTENDPKRVFQSARWRLNKMVHEISDEETKSLFDVGFTGFPIFLTSQIDIDETLVGGFKQGMSSMNSFQQYKAILDMDGNSWSSRFSTMVCYNSLAIKVEPEYADHFFFDLVPWKHYVPVKADLSDLIDNIKFVLDPSNDGIVRNIIGAANQWCMQRLTKQALALDQLDVWNSYVERLEGPSTVPGAEKKHFAELLQRLPVST